MICLVRTAEQQAAGIAADLTAQRWRRQFDARARDRHSALTAQARLNTAGVSSGARTTFSLAAALETAGVA